MNQQKLLQIMVGVGLILLLSVGCSAPATPAHRSKGDKAMKKSIGSVFLTFLFLTVLLSACSSPTAASQQPTAILSPTQVPTFTPVPSSTETATPVPTNTSTETPLPPTPTPIPPTPTLPPNTRIFKLVSEGGHVVPAGGSPYILDGFTSDGKKPAGIFADFRNTQFDITSVDKQSRNVINVAVQIASREIQHTILVDGTDLDTFYINDEYIVYPFPPNVSVTKEGGPFIRLVFHKQRTAESLNGWTVKIKQKEREVSGNLSSSGSFDLANVTSDPIQCTLKDPASSKTYGYIAFPAVRGAVEGIVVYMIWNVDK